MEMPRREWSSSRGLGKIVLLALTLTGCSFVGSAPTGGAASIRVAEAALAGGTPQVALQVAQHILERAPDNVPALVARGDALTQLGQHDAAVASFERALQADRTSIRGQIGLGRIRLTTDPAEAATLFRAVLLAEPTNAVALTDLGIALDLLGQHAEAHPFYRRALVANPNNLAAQANLALSLAMAGDTVGALQLAEPLGNDRTAPVKLRHNYAAILTMAGREAEAKQLLRQDLAHAQVEEAMAGYRQSAARATPQAAPEIADRSGPGAAPVRAETPAETPVPTQTVAAVDPVAAPAVLAAAPLPQVHTPTQTTETLVVTQTSAPLPATAAPSAFVAAAPIPLGIPASVPRAEPVAASPQPTGFGPGPRVQLGAFGSEAAATAEWQRLQKRVPALLADRAPAITTVERNGQMFWRLRTAGFWDQSNAQDFCSQVRPQKAKCLVYAG